MYYTGKECDVSLYTEAYEAIKSVPIVQAATVYDNKDIGETTILILNEAIWMGDQMEHTLINPNQLRAYGITAQDNPFDPAPIFISTEDNEFTLPLNSKESVLGVATRTPTNQELQTCPHVVLSSEHEWDPQNLWFPRASRTVEEEISRTVGAVMTQDGASTEDPDNDAMDCVFDIGNIPKRLIASIKVASPLRQISQVETEAQDLPPIKTFLVSPEDLSELEQSKETLKRTTQRVIQSAVMPLARQYHADRMFQTKRLAGKWASDTMDGHVKSLDGNQYAQVFSNGGFFFAEVYPMACKADAGLALKSCIMEFGDPEDLTIDGSKEQNSKGTEFMKSCRRNNI
jgi:hypothetical protein